MQTIRDLKQRGFTVQASTASGCTEVVLSGKFYFFNPKFLDGALFLAASLKNAGKLDDTGKHCIIVAGTYTDDDVFPLVLLDEKQFTAVHLAHANHQEAKEKADEARAALVGMMHSLIG